MLPGRVDGLGIVDIRAGQSFEPIKAVEARPVLAHLNEPRPDQLRRRVNGNRARALDAVGYNRIPRQRARTLLLGCAPAQMPAADRKRIDDGDTRGGERGQSIAERTVHRLSSIIQQPGHGNLLSEKRVNGSGIHLPA
jgi:hypothetical protein